MYMCGVLPITHITLISCIEYLLTELALEVLVIRFCLVPDVTPHFKKVQRGGIIFSINILSFINRKILENLVFRI